MWCLHNNSSEMAFYSSNFHGQSQSDWIKMWFADTFPLQVYKNHVFFLLLTILDTGGGSQEVSNKRKWSEQYSLYVTERVYLNEIAIKKTFYGSQHSSQQAIDNKCSRWTFQFHEQHHHEDFYLEISFLALNSPSLWLYNVSQTWWECSNNHAISFYVSTEFHIKL